MSENLTLYSIVATREQVDEMRKHAPAGAFELAQLVDEADFQDVRRCAAMGMNIAWAFNYAFKKEKAQ